MISFNQLGNLGRLGNQMFQYASLKGIAANRKYDFCIPPESQFGTTDSNVKNADANIYTAFNLNEYNKCFGSNKIVEESKFDFDEDLFNNCEDNVDLYGYFQSEKYFKNIENEIRKDFSFKDEIKFPSKELFEEVFGDLEVVSLHVRRGDYINNAEHPIPSLDYYNQALSQIKSELPVMVFSDDIEWCKGQKIFTEDRFIFSENNNSAVDLCLQSLCKYHIIANSSFSWWGAWLAKSKKVIAPKKWFGGYCNKNSTKDLFPDDWKILDS